MPRLKGRRSTCAPRSAAIPAVRSVEPSSTTTISNPGSNAWISSITLATLSSSFNAGTIAIRFSSPSCANTASRGGAGTAASSAMRSHRSAEPDELEDLTSAVSVRVLVENTLPGTSPHRLRSARIVEQLSIRGQRLVGRRDDPQLGADVEPALDPLVWVRDDRGARSRELEGPARRRRVDGRMRAPRDVEIDPRPGDCLREDVEGNIADDLRAADVPAKVLAAQGKVDLRIASARLADQRLHPLTPELVAVAVEKDVVLLLDRCRLEQLRVGGPEHGLRTACAELAQTVEPALRVGEDEVVLRGIRTVVVVEAGVHAAELRQAHRHVAVIEHHRHVEALTQPCGDPPQVRHRHGEDDHCGDVALALENAFEMTLPSWRDVAPDRLARELVTDRVLWVVLAAAKERVALQPSREAARAGEELRLAVEGVGGRPPPRRLDCAPSVGSDDEIHADLVEALPDLPPRRRAPVPEIEVGRGRDGEDLRRSGHRLSMAKGCVGPVSGPAR